MTPLIAPEHLAALVDWLYNFLLNVLGAFAIIFLVAVLVGQELLQAIREPSKPDPNPVINSTVVGLLLIAFLILVVVHVLRILRLL